MVVHVFHAVPALGCDELKTNILFSPLLWGWAPWDIKESKDILALHPWGGGGGGVWHSRRASRGDAE